MSLANFLLKTIGSDILLATIEEQDWYKLGQEQAQPIDTFLDDKFGEKKSEIIQQKISPAIEKFIEGFTDKLLSDQNEED
jgi:hypothetical protein